MNCTIFRPGILGLLALSVWLPGVAQAQQQPYSHGNPSIFEQYMLELINRARANPSGEAARFGIALNANLPAGTISTAPKAPVAFHPLLIAAARKHSDWMLNTNTFSHTGLNGSTPTTRASWEGFTHGVAENIAWRGTSGTVDQKSFTELSHEGLFLSAGHRNNTMNPGQAIIGLGLRSGRFNSSNAWMTTQKFSTGGDTLGSGPFILGVVYKDTNGNNAYDPGEGIPGVEVRPSTGTYYAVTSASGGYAIPFPPSPAVGMETVNLPFPVNGADWSAVEPYDLQFRAQKTAAAPNVTLTVRASGGGLPAPMSQNVQMKASQRINYQLRGTDSWFYSRSTTTALNVKVDFRQANPPQPSPDFNRDGKPDMLVRNSASGANVVWFMNGAVRTGSSAITTVPGNAGWAIAGLADFNSDGRVDILWSNSSTGVNSVWFMNGATRTGVANLPSNTPSAGWAIAGIGDFNADSKPDIVWRNTATGANVVWYMNGTTRTGTGQFPALAANSGWTLAGVADFNADARPDLIWRNAATGANAVWFMNGTTRTGTASLPALATGSGWSIQGFSDFNLDGRTDIIWRNPTTGANTVWLMNGITRVGILNLPSLAGASWRLHF